MNKCYLKVAFILHIKQKTKARTNEVRLLIKFSGESFSSNGKAVDYKSVYAVANILKSFKDKGNQIGVVIGGGNVIRGREWSDNNNLGDNSIDFAGMMATISNGLVLQSALRKMGANAVCYSGISVRGVGLTSDLNFAIKNIDEGKIVIFCGGLGEPCLSTDMTAALRASQMRASKFIKFTKVNGVYNEDPKENSNAKKIDKISFESIIKNSLSVIDIEAVAILMKFNIMTIVAKHDTDSAKNVLNDIYDDCSIICSECACAK